MTDNIERHAELKAQMTICLDALRRKVAVQMEATYDALDKLPKIKGEDTPTLAGDRRMNRDESGGIVAGMIADGGMGLSSAVRAVSTVGTELFGSRNATRMREQDKPTYSFGELKKIREKKKNLMALLSSLGEKIDLLDTYKSCGVSRVALMQDGTLEALTDLPGTSLKLTAAKRRELENDYQSEPMVKLHKPHKLGMRAA